MRREEKREVVCNKCNGKGKVIETLYIDDRNCNKCRHINRCQNEKSRYLCPFYNESEAVPKKKVPIEKICKFCSGIGRVMIPCPGGPWTPARGDCPKCFGTGIIPECPNSIDGKHAFKLKMEERHLRKECLVCGLLERDYLDELELAKEK